MDYYKKYLKYKNKYFLLRGGNKYNEYISAINSYFKDKNICTKDDLHIDGIRMLKEDVGALKGFGGAHLLFGSINRIPVCVKIFVFNEKTVENYDKNINEIGLTHFISDYFLSHPKLTDNFTTFYISRHCDKYLENELKISKDLREFEKNIYNTDANIMIVEKVMGDLKSFIVKNYKLPNFPKIILSILIQICYTLQTFKTQFGEFYHGDFHSGNILLADEVKEMKTYIIIKGDLINYKLKLKTFNLCPKIWDFQTSYIKYINDKLLINDDTIISKFFNYKSEHQLKIFKAQSGETITNDLEYLIKTFPDLLYTDRDNPIIRLIYDTRDNLSKNIKIKFDIFLTNLIELLDDDEKEEDEYDDTVYDFKYES